MSIVYFCLIGFLALRPPVLQFQLRALPLVCVFIRFVFVVYSCFVFLVNQGRSKGEGWSIINYFKPEAI